MITVNIHASCVVLADAGACFGAPRDAGVLILGESGAGKSDLALRLIATGAILVADDRCDLFVEGDAIFARAPDTLSGLLEVRGVGVVSMRTVAQARLAVAVRLVTANAVVRLPGSVRYKPPEPLGASPEIWPPEIALNPFDTSAPAKLVAAAAAFAGGLLRETTVRST